MRLTILSKLASVGIPPLLETFEQGKTYVFMGSSGVGKSSLVNAICDSKVQATGGIREDDAKGKHVTIFRSLIEVPTGGCILDTPGMRELEFWDAGEGISATFEDVEAILSNCRFLNCSHSNEPGCALSSALDDGSLDFDRYQSYLKYLGEQRFSASMVYKLKRLLQ